MASSVVPLNSELLRPSSHHLCALISLPGLSRWMADRSRLNVPVVSGKVCWMSVVMNSVEQCVEQLAKAELACR